jgi:hypothetical protein
LDSHASFLAEQNRIALREHAILFCSVNGGLLIELRELCAFQGASFLIPVNAACDAAQRAAYQGACSEGASRQGADSKACTGSDGTAGQGSLLRAGHVCAGGSAQKHQYHEREK